MSIVTYNNRSIANISAIPGTAKSLTHIKTLTASDDANLTFTHGSSDVVLDSTYPIYVFKYINMHPAADSKTLKFNLSTDSFSSEATKTTTFFRAYHDEAGSATTLSYDTGEDLAQSTNDQTLGELIGGDNDQSASGTLTLFNPSSTTFVKHFIAETSYAQQADYAFRGMMAGYANTTSAINSVRFKFSSANIGSGTIKLYGIKDS
jgi:hypothetical protein